MEIKLCGVGGQGMGVAGRLLGEAAILAGLRVAQTTAYGVESRGGLSTADVIISPEPIYFPEVRRPDVILLLAEKGLKANLRGVHAETLVFYDPGTVSDLPANPGQLLALPFLKTSLEALGDREAAAMIALGAIVEKTGAVAFEVLEEALRKTMPVKAQRVNLEALRLGMKMV